MHCACTGSKNSHRACTGSKSGPWAAPRLWAPHGVRGRSAEYILCRAGRPGCPAPSAGGCSMQVASMTAMRSRG